MARKRLIKGANAVRVEERIARVPVDVSLPQFEPGSGIFDALRAMEAPKVLKAPAERSGTAVQGRSPKRKPAPVSAPTAAPVPALVPRTSPARASGTPSKPTKPGRVGTSDFTAKERETIVRCCTDYRNHLPIYLLAVQMEVEIIDSVIDKCRASGIRPKKN